MSVLMQPPDSKHVSETLQPQENTTPSVQQAEYAEVTQVPLITEDPRVEEIELLLNQYELVNAEQLHYFLQTDSTELANRPGQAVRSASLIKITVMMEVYRQIHEGELSFDDYVQRYAFAGTVEQALDAMMHFSNNSATGALIQAVGGTDAVNATIDNYLGTDAVTTLHHTPGFYSEAGASKNNVTTVQEQVELMQLLEDGKIVSPWRSKQMLQLMRGTRDYFGIRSIDDTDTVAFKTGYFPSYLYGLTGSVAQFGGKTYRFSIILEDWDKNSAKWSGIREVLLLLDEYAEIN